MANRKISDLTALTAPVTGDLLPIVDISEAAAADKNKKITYGTFLSSVPLGTAAAPSIAFTGDPNTGIYSPGADQLAISTSGTGRLLVDASGKLGVNMTPASGTVVDILAANNTSLSPTLRVNSNNLAVNSSLAYDGLSGSGQVTIQAGASSALIFGANAGEKMRILSGGNVGIGTSLPGAKLEVAGSDAAPNGVGDFALSYASSKRLVFGDTGSPTFCSWIQSTQTLGGAFWPLALNPSGGNVGIGTTAPGGLLHVGSDGIIITNTLSELAPPTTSNDSYIFRSNNDGSLQFSSRPGAGGKGYRFWRGANITLFNDENGTTTLTSAASTAPFIAKIGSSEVSRIDSSGRLLVGTSTARTLLSQSMGIQIETTDYPACGLSIINNQNADANPLLLIGKSRGATLNSNTIVQSGDTLGEIHFLGADGSAMLRAASIRCLVDGTPGANDMPSRLVFATAVDGGSSPTERLRITSTGQVRLAGAGITFNGDTAAANELDDYEEGTFTPTAGAGITINSGTPAYSGFYTKIGRMVNITISQTAGNITATVGTGAVFTGLPFTPGTSLQACSVTNGNPDISGSGLIYNSPGTGAIYIGFTATSQTSLTFTGTYFV